MADHQNMSIHLIAGGLAGTAGAVLTCPLEVVKTRFQASSHVYSTPHIDNLFKKTQQATHKAGANIATASLHHNTHTNLTPNFTTTNLSTVNTLIFNNSNDNNNNNNNNKKHNHHHHHHHNSKSIVKANYPKLGIGIALQMRSIIQNEGYSALFKGLVPNLLGVAPYRAIYFFSYANSKVLFLQVFKEEKPILHICSAIVAGFSAVTLTNPIWFVKTRLQLDQSKDRRNAIEVTKKIFRDKGPLGFYKGISASYVGISETALYFVLYEQLKRLTLNRSDDNPTFLSCFTSAGFSKTLASCICYPHEVVRTRLRQEGDKYKGFMQSIALILREESFKGLYKGMATHLVRQIPNTAIVMTTYELIVGYFLNNSNCKQC